MNEPKRLTTEELKTWQQCFNEPTSYKLTHSCRSVTHLICHIAALEAEIIQITMAAELAAHTALDREKEITKLSSRCCAICNDTGALDDAQGWDVGQQPSDCPYCPHIVDKRREETALLRKAVEHLRTCPVHLTIQEGYAPERIDPKIICPHPSHKD